MTSPLRDLAARIEDVARQHPAYSQAWQPVRTLVDHLSALAGIEEANALNYKLNKCSYPSCDCSLGYVGSEIPETVCPRKKWFADALAP